MASKYLECLSRKQFAPETYKKIRWVTGMYREWRQHRNQLLQNEVITVDLDDVTTLTPEAVLYAFCRFLTEIRKVDGTDFPPRTLYEILICLQFQLEIHGIVWKLKMRDSRL